MNEKYNCWYINFNIKKYNSIDDITHIINLLDKKMCGEEKIYGTNINVKILRYNDSHYDYICKTNILCDEKLIMEYLYFKFKQTENQIKFYNDRYGFDWYVSYTLE
jgi:hypothetical protein